MKNFVNPNPRVGVLLQHGNASVRLTNVLRHFKLKGLNWFQKVWPEARLRAEVFGYGENASREWNGILKARGHPHFESPPKRPGVPKWRARNSNPPHAGWYYVRPFDRGPAPNPVDPGVNSGIRYFDDSDGTWWLPRREGLTPNDSFSEWLFIPGLDQRL